jgi:hypothetical protein
MSTAESGSAKPGLGLWPKLVLWSLVLVFGVLYLGSVKRNPAVEAPMPVSVSPPPAEPEAAPSPGDAGLDPGAQQVPAEDQVLAGAGGQEEQVQAPAGDSEPVRVAESAAFVDSLLNKEVADESPGESPGATAPEARSPPVRTPAAGTPDSTLPAAEAPDDRPVTAASVESVGSTPDAAAKAPPAQGEPAPSHEVVSGDMAQEPREAQRERILKEYEAMRRAAEEQMRQYWQQRGRPGPAGMPYGHPGYGYGPGGYPPR